VKTAWSSDIQHDVVSLLRERLRAAKSRNSRFSLRAYAKRLGVDHSTLSQVLRGRRGLSKRDLETAGKRLGLSEQIIREYAHGAKRPEVHKAAQKHMRSYQLDLDTFQLLSAWHHYAILELVHIHGFKADSRWIASTLGIPVEEVNVALQRLLRLGLLEMTGRDRWIDKSGDAEFHSASLDEAAANELDREIHELAIAATKRTRGEYRAQRQVVLACDSKNLPRVRRMADRFIAEVRSMAAESKRKDDVYQLEISFFPVTMLKGNKGDQDG